MISKEQFILRQPAAPEETSTDPYYLSLANRLVKIANDKRLLPSYPEKVVERSAMAVIGYYQDVICDAGIWHSFVDECRRMYGYHVPFYDEGEDYMDYELNRMDVRFMVWYSLSMNYEHLRVRNPFDEELISCADAWWRELESVYDESPMPEDYRLTHELEIHAEEDKQALYKLGNWLFMHCYLMTPAYAFTLSEIASEFDLTKEDSIIELQKRMEQSMSEDPTGPLSLYLGEWLYLIVEGKMPSTPKGKDEKGDHKFYTAFTHATGGKILEFFATYDDLNKFFIEGMGWAEGEDHLPMMKNERDFVVMVDKEKGMLVARNVAKCIASPDNPLYDSAYAKNHAINLLTERGCCPGDLLRYICAHDWLPDARFPYSDDYGLVKRNIDFIARCYLQQYYRGD